LTPKQREAWGRVIEAERLERGWSKARMGRELGVTYETIRSWCKGETMPPAKLRRVVAGKLGWEVEPTKFVVQFVYQEVVVAESQVHAIRAARTSLPTGAHRKAEYLSIKKV
jgi:transcriptional regulator with XRE-family HTH domain